MARLTLDVDGSVALSLVSVATSATIEEVHVVNPYVVVVGVERYGVVHTYHVGEVAQLNTLGTTDEESKAMSSCIESNTLDGDVHIGGTTLTFDLYTLGTRVEGVNVGLLYGSDDTDTERTCLLALLESTKDCLQSSVLCVGIGHNVTFDGLGSLGSNVDDTCAVLQRTVVLVCTDTVRHTNMGET